MGLILQQMIQDRFGTDSLFLHGGTTRKKRDEMVECFQNDAREKINAMLKEKKELADLAVSAGEKWVGELSNRDLKALFSIT